MQQQQRNVQTDSKGSEYSMLGSSPEARVQSTACWVLPLKQGFAVPCFSGCLQLGNELQKQSRDQTQAIKPADWSVWSRDRFCKLQAT